MTDINSKTDEKGVHMCCCTAESPCATNAAGLCTHDLCHEEECICYPKMVQIVAALRGLITCDSKANSGNHWVDRLAEARKALSHD